MTIRLGNNRHGKRYAGLYQATQYLAEKFVVYRLGDSFSFNGIPILHIPHISDKMWTKLIRPELRRIAEQQSENIQISTPYSLHHIVYF